MDPRKSKSPTLPICDEGTYKAIAKFFPVVAEKYKTAEEEASFDLQRRIQVNFVDVHALFFKKLNFKRESVLNLGIGPGRLDLALLTQQWSVTGYEFSRTYIHHLENALLEKQKECKDIGELYIRQQDLNAIDPYTEKLTYEKELKDDLVVPTNIFMIGVAPFLINPALCKLLFLLMDSAKPGTVFVFETGLLPKKWGVRSLEEHQKFCSLPKHYLASFFARTDIVTEAHFDRVDDDNVNEVLILLKTGTHVADKDLDSLREYIREGAPEPELSSLRR